MNAVTSIEQAQKIHYAEVRRRLYGVQKRPAPVIEVKPVIEVAPMKAKQLPIWEYQPIQFDQHVIAFRHWQLAMQQIMRFSTNTNVHLNPSDFIIPEPKKAIKDIVDEVLKEYPGWSWEDIKSKRRNRKLVVARHSCMKEVHKQRPDLSFPQIGRIFNRDHTSILHAVGRLRKDIRQGQAKGGEGK